MTSTQTDLTERNITILTHRGGRMIDEGRRPGVPPDPQETTLRSGHTNKILVNGDSHGAASQPRFSGCVPSSAEGGGCGAVVTLSFQCYSLLVLYFGQINDDDDDVMI